MLLPGVILASADRGQWSGPTEQAGRSLIAAIDGMGGHGHGSLAAALTAVVLAESVTDTATMNAPTEGWLNSALQAASDFVVGAGSLNPSTRLMGAAIAGIAVTPTEVTVFHLGDCRVYVADSGYLTLITTDHRSSSGQAQLTRSIGGTGRADVVQPDFVTLPRDANRRYLLCTDGVWEALPFAGIQDALDAPTPPEVVDVLMAAVLENAPGDNLTIVVVDVPERG